MDNNWKTATKADRAALYHVARAIADTTNLTVEAIMEQAFGHKLMVGTDYLSNFRSGAIGRPKAKLIHAWLAEHHADTAHAVDPRLFPKTHADAWGDYLANHAIHGKLRIVRFDKSMGLVQRKRNQPKPDEILKLGEEFCFHLDSDVAGHTVAFQLYEGILHPLPLGLSDNSIAAVSMGEQFLPLDGKGFPEKLTEANDLGLHQFVIAVAEDEGKLPTSTVPPETDSGCSVHSIQVQFTV
ncbi:hypothetical protein [Phaeobacter inhibens]|uniref:hypothetical protein n=1 Tax=Phaeobacter inhibens TaxID=221822 RepID=UPI000C9A2F42|nr:hypothetical protein [Phaeobacter inhibens]AUR08041.1 hypothetical protein PhaeoP59_01869 [Phaeobacter inhibens]